MATTKSTARGAAKPTSAAAHSHKELESKIADLEGKLASALSAISGLEKRLSACESKPEPKAAPAASGRDEDLRNQLRVWFETMDNHKVRTQKPQI